jgi:hypothetical protein
VGQQSTAIQYFYGLGQQATSALLELSEIKADIGGSLGNMGIGPASI